MALLLPIFAADQAARERPQYGEPAESTDGRPDRAVGHPDRRDPGRGRLGGGPGQLPAVSRARRRRTAAARSCCRISSRCWCSASRSAGPSGRWAAMAARVASTPRPASFRDIWPHRAAKYFGAFALLIPLVIYMYYVLIEAWCLGYAYDYLVGNLLLGSEPARLPTSTLTSSSVDERPTVSSTGRGATNLVCCILVSRFSAEFCVDLPRREQGHRKVLQHRDAADGVSVRCACWCACSRSVATRNRSVADGLGLDVESRSGSICGSRKPGWPPPGKSSSAFRWVSESSSTTPVICVETTTWR